MADEQGGGEERPEARPLVNPAIAGRQSSTSIPTTRSPSLAVPSQTNTPQGMTRAMMDRRQGMRRPVPLAVSTAAAAALAVPSSQSPSFQQRKVGPGGLFPPATRFPVTAGITTARVASMGRSSPWSTGPGGGGGGGGGALSASTSTSRSFRPGRPEKGEDNIRKYTEHKLGSKLSDEEYNDLRRRRMLDKEATGSNLGQFIQKEKERRRKGKTPSVQAAPPPLPVTALSSQAPVQTRTDMSGPISARPSLSRPYNTPVQYSSRKPNEMPRTRRPPPIATNFAPGQTSKTVTLPNVKIGEKYQIATARRKQSQGRMTETKPQCAKSGKRSEKQVEQRAAELWVMMCLRPSWRPGESALTTARREEMANRISTKRSDEYWTEWERKAADKTEVIRERQLRRRQGPATSVAQGKGKQKKGKGPKEEGEEERREEQARQERWERTRDETAEEINAVFEDIDYDEVVKGGQVTPWRDVPRQLSKVRPSAEVVERVERIQSWDERRILYIMMDPYLHWVQRVVQRVQEPDWRCKETARRHNRKLAAVRAKAAQVLDEAELKLAEKAAADDRAVAEAGKIEGDGERRARRQAILKTAQDDEETIWKLKVLQTAADHFSEKLWFCREEKLKHRGRFRLQYVDGLPVDLGPRAPKIRASSWRSRWDDFCGWTRCVQCEAAGVRQCSAERSVPRDASRRACRRCSRLGHVCVRLVRDKELSMWPRDLARMGWNPYEAADGQSLTKEKAREVAGELIERRGKRLVNICGSLVDAEDIKNFALPAIPKIDDIGINAKREGPEQEENEKAVAAFKDDDIGGQKLLSPGEKLRAGTFADRMAMLKRDEFWDQQSTKYGRGRQDDDGLKLYKHVERMAVFNYQPPPQKLLAL